VSHAPVLEKIRLERAEPHHVFPVALSKPECPRPLAVGKALHVRHRSAQHSSQKRCYLLQGQLRPPPPSTCCLHTPILTGRAGIYTRLSGS
jgi:hypothetical protein